MGDRQRIDVTPRQAAALSRLLDAYLAAEGEDPGEVDLRAVQVKVDRLDHDHTMYEDEGSGRD